MISPNRRKRSTTKVRTRMKLAARRHTVSRETNPFLRRANELALCLQVIDKSALAHEPALVSSAWIEYGYMGPLERTELFCKEYAKAYKRFFAKYHDSFKAGDLQPIDEELLKNDPGEISSLWRARQIADEIGMPYPLYLTASIGSVAEHKNRKKLPRPNQLYTHPQVVAAQEKWEQERAITGLYREGWDPRFFQQNVRPDPPRKAALRHALNRIKQSRHPEAALSTLMGSQDAIRPRAARLLFSDQPEVFDSAMMRMGAPNVERPVSEFESYVPPCIGLPLSKPAPSCSSCPLAVACHKVRLLADKLLVKDTGSNDPLGEHRRGLARDRQRKRRAKLRAAEEASD